MIQVGFSRPYGSFQMIMLVQLMEPGAILVIHDHFIQILHEFCIVFRIFFPAGHMIKNRRSIDCLCKCPVHTVMYHRFSLPVCCVYNPRCTICIPAVFYGCCIKVLCCLEIIFQFFFLFPAVCKCPLSDQPCPLNSMARCCTIWLERVIRAVAVAVKICHPFLCEILQELSSAQRITWSMILPARM